MKIWRSDDRGTPANASCLATPSPQSITYATPLLTITCAEPELAFRGRGPPPVPRRISLVPLWRAARRTRVESAAAPARKQRRLIPGRCATIRFGIVIGGEPKRLGIRVRARPGAAGPRAKRFRREQTRPRTQGG